MRKHQSGFTLVEIAIVLVIIGLLLGGVLKGQELINSAKVKNLANDFRNIATFVYAYQDKFRALPGDDAAAVAHVNGTPASTPEKALGNGRIDGAWDSTNKTDESYLFWQHVRLAGLATGTTETSNAADYVPRNADGGKMGVTGNTVLSGWAGNFFICSSGIQGRFARQLDTMIDDGNTATGAVRVLGANDKGVAIAQEVKTTDDATLFTICVAN
jgi:prepilin-type N-terminal cleavage/methylation domain-containing protein